MLIEGVGKDVRLLLSQVNDTNERGKVGRLVRLFAVQSKRRRFGGRVGKAVRPVLFLHTKPTNDCGNVGSAVRPS